MVIDRDDHPPAHVPVVGDGEAKIDLIDVDGTPRLLFAEALERGRMARMAEPRVVEARDDRTAGRMAVDLTNGRTFLFPPRSLEGLESASDDEIAAVEVLGNGSGLHREAGGADYTIAGLLAGRFGTKADMEAGSRDVRAADQGGPALKVG